MKYVVLIHSHPKPWGHPTSEFVPEHQTLPDERRAALQADFDALLTELSASGELLDGLPLGDPYDAVLVTWTGDEPTVAARPYAYGPDHLAGYFLLDVATPERARELAVRFAGPGETVELRPAAT